MNIMRSLLLASWLGLGLVATVTAHLAPAAEKEVQLENASWEQTREIIAAHKGKVVVLDLWSTYCESCVKEFPGLVALQEKHGPEVVCISLNCNNIGGNSLQEDRPDVLKFLQEQRAAMRNLMSSDPDEMLYKKVGVASIPVVQVFDRTGKLHKQFDNEKELYGREGFTYEKHIAPLVAKLVSEKK